MIPSIHMNGTSQHDLLDQYAKARAALRAAILALQDAAPNGRDYYPQGSNAIGKAIEEHRARLTSLENVHDELGTIMDAVHSASPFKRGT